MKTWGIVCIGVALAVGATASEQKHQHPASDPEKLGQVHFSVSCNAAAQEEFNRAVAMLHSFWYEKAAEAFAEVAKQDPSCATAYWGVAMTHYHPLWEVPNRTSLAAGRAAIERAKALGPKTEREREYITALGTFYKDFEQLDHLTRVLAYEQAMERLSRRYPDDPEAAIFYALSLLGSATSAPPDKTLAKQKRAGELLLQIFAQQPEHPGVAHYIIHAYDYPELADQALTAARRYAKIAPDSPHALHMPSHIFTRLGLWGESIASNLDSAAAARKYDWAGEGLHALDYLAYAYLQRAQDEKARQVLESLPPVKKDDPSYFAGLYARAVAPTRYGVERRQWAEAASLEIKPGTVPGGRYAWVEATLRFTRGLGAARTGDVQQAQKELERLASLRDTLNRVQEKYWAEQVEVQSRAVAAWLALAEGRKQKALELMRSAADLEDALGKHPVTPGPIVPARELLGELLLELQQPAQALREFEKTLEASPKRFNALYGAGRAAELSGNQKKAKLFYAKLVALSDQADGERAELRTAKAFLANSEK